MGSFFVSYIISDIINLANIQKTPAEFEHGSFYIGFDANNKTSDIRLNSCCIYLWLFFFCSFFLEDFTLRINTCERSLDFIEVRLSHIRIRYIRRKAQNTSAIRLNTNFNISFFWILNRYLIVILNSALVSLCNADSIMNMHFLFNTLFTDIIENRFFISVFAILIIFFTRIIVILIIIHYIIRVFITLKTPWSLRNFGLENELLSNII